LSWFSHETPLEALRANARASRSRAAALPFGVIHNAALVGDLLVDERLDCVDELFRSKGLKMRKLLVGLLIAGSLCLACTPRIAVAGGGDVAAGVVGGLAVGTLFGAAVASACGALVCCQVTREGDVEGQASVAAFQERLLELGWTKGRNIQIDIRWTGGDPDKARGLLPKNRSMPHQT
jgi:hypothetical protein